MTEFIFKVVLDDDTVLERTIKAEKRLTQDQKANVVKQVAGDASTAGWLQPAEDYNSFVHYPPQRIKHIDVQVIENEILLATGQQIANVSSGKLVA